MINSLAGIPILESGSIKKPRPSAASIRFVVDIKEKTIAIIMLTLA
jgi:hypothetical protein